MSCQFDVSLSVRKKTLYFSDNPDKIPQPTKTNIAMMNKTMEYIYINLQKILNRPSTCSERQKN